MKIKLNKLALIGLGFLIVWFAGRPAGATEKRPVSSRKLRVIMLKDTTAEAILARRMSPADYERALMRSFAESCGLEIEYIPIAQFADLFPALKAKKGDIIAATLTETEARRQLAALSDPFAYSREQIVTSTKKRQVNSIADLKGLTGRIQPGTVYEDTLRKFRQQQPQVEAVALPHTYEPDELLDAVAAGKIDFTILDDHFIEAFQTYRDDVKVIHTFAGQRNLVFAVDPDKPALLERLNKFIRTELPHHQLRSYADDLPQIKKRKFLRVLTRNDPFCYFLHRGTAMGFEYELIARFAKEQGLTPVMIIPPRWNDMEKWLEEGKGDVIAANFTLTRTRLENMNKVIFSHPYAGVRQVVVGRSGESPITSLAALAERTIYAQRGTAYWDTLRKLQTQGLPFQLLAAPNELEPPEILRKVASGEYDLAVADDLAVNLLNAYGSDIKEVMAISQKEPFAWVFRASSPELAQAASAFLKREDRGVFFNTIYKKYYSPPTRRQQDTVRELISQQVNRISPYDPFFIKYADKFALHWCLLAAQAYQESRFNPAAKSPVGAIGIMQIMPGTANELGFDDVSDPENGIHAGAAYLAKQRKRISGKVDYTDQLCFALASYNAGYGHLLDARKLAGQLGYSQDVWFDHVEKALMLLAEDKYASRAKYGYCRAFETVAYVREIILRSKLYADHMKHKIDIKLHHLEGGEKQP